MADRPQAPGSRLPLFPGFFDWHMLHGSSSPGVVGSELTRILARLADGTFVAPPSPEANLPVFAERLGHWLSWTGAIALNSALQVPSAAPGQRQSEAFAADRGAQALKANRTVQAAQDDFQRVQAALEASIAAGPPQDGPSPTDFAPYRRHCLQQQQAMQDAIGALRRRLREALRRQSPAGARLAAIDAVMDDALASHERSLLGLVPLRLQAHFERVQHTAPPESDWRSTFERDLALALRTERDHRLLPARGLLDALTTAPCP